MVQRAKAVGKTLTLEAMMRSYKENTLTHQQIKDTFGQWVRELEECGCCSHKNQ